MFASQLHAQQAREPHIGYAFPAGARQGTLLEINVGGQFLDDAQSALLSGSGVRMTLVKVNRPLPQKRFQELRDYLEETRKKIQASKEAGVELRRLGTVERTSSVLKEAGATEDEIKLFFELRKQRNDPKRQQNMQLAESVTFKVEVDPNAAPGVRELRLLTGQGATNPITFCIGSLPEKTGVGQIGTTLETASRVTLPTILNGWIPPGGVHAYSFQGRSGAHLVVAAQARDLMPYLADAVPGWFQPVIKLQDAQGKEVAYADHFRFSPDPVLCCDLPHDGVYLLEIRDALYRGREDFVYRVTVGEVPFVTGFFPLGGRTGTSSKIEVSGWNLSKKTATLPPRTEDGIQPLPEFGNGFAAGGAVFACDSLPQITASPGEHTRPVKLPVIINGRINALGDIEAFTFSCEAGETVVAETYARRLNSPLDSWLKVTDSNGKTVGFNDDFEDKSAELQTHSADSHLVFTAPKKGVYTVQLGDSQGQGGPEFAYRLRISAPVPDFSVRIVPSCINARLGATVPVTLYALRKDGFDGAIQVALKEPSDGFFLNGGESPPGQTKVRATLTFPQMLSAAQLAAIPPRPSPTPTPTPTPSPVSGDPAMMMTPTPTPAPSPVLISIPGKLGVEAHAHIGGAEVTRPAVPVDDRTQAFMLHHLVPTYDWLVVTTGTARGRVPMKITTPSPMRLPVGGTAQVTLALPGNPQPLSPGKMQLQLSDPPDGIAIESFTSSSITFRADPAKVKSGLKDNLIIETFGEFTTIPKDGKPGEKKRYPSGFLPAIPFETVQP